MTAIVEDAARPDPRRWWVLAIVVAAQFIYVVDAFIVNVALPSIKTDLAATAGEIQGVVVCYLIAFATLVVIGGRLGDIHGAKPVFLYGLLGFTGASLWCGLTHSGGELVLARTVQGATAALTQVLRTIHRLFQNEERGRAFGIYGTTLGLGAAVGFGLGGWIVALDLLTDRSAVIALLAVLIFNFANIAFYLVLTLYLQLGLGFTPLQSGTVVLPLALTFALVSRKAGPRTQRRGPSAIVKGCGVQVLGLAILATSVAFLDPLSPILAAGLLIVFGVGQAMTMAPLYGFTLSRIPAAHAGSGAGVLSTVQQIGNGSGAAVIGALYFTVQSHYADRLAFMASLTALAAAAAATAGLLSLLRKPHRLASPAASSGTIAGEARRI